MPAPRIGSPRLGRHRQCQGQTKDFDFQCVLVYGRRKPKGDSGTCRASHDPNVGTVRAFESRPYEVDCGLCALGATVLPLDCLEKPSAI